MNSMDTITSMKDLQGNSKTRDHHCSNNNTTLIKSHDPNLNPKGYSWNSIYNYSHNQGSFINQDAEDYLINAFSWPPISYTCSFCRREFRSAQALGGHMNVHRKDRARLRQSAPMPPRDGTTVVHYGRYGGSTSTAANNFLNLNNQNQNPSPSFSSSYLSADASSLRSLTSKPPLVSSLSQYFVHDNNDHVEAVERGNDRSFFSVNGSVAAISVCRVGSEERKEGSAEKCGKSLKKKKRMNETEVRLELEMSPFHDHEEGLDLELRLGYSN